MTFASAHSTTDLPDSLGDRLANLQHRLADLYRDLHEHPELSLQEHRTARQVAEFLRPLGFEVTENVGGTGVVGLLRNGDGPVVMLRSDLDALPVREDTGLTYASTVRATGADGQEVPVMHACGHDMHITCLLGAATLLAESAGTWSGTLLAVFQPAEELARGAQDMVDDGLFERFPVPDVVLGQHVAPLPAGTIAYGSGPIMAATDTANVVLHGRGGHGSRPESTIDPVLMAAHVITRLQGIIPREIAASEAAVLTVGRLQAGTKDNIIPDRAELGINVRSYTEQTRSLIRSAIERVLHAEAEASAAPEPPRSSGAVPRRRPSTTPRPPLGPSPPSPPSSARTTWSCSRPSLRARTSACSDGSAAPQRSSGSWAAWTPTSSQRP